ncbi:MAG: hypothetical protein R3B45_14555 [Bdellovibrionota bacterium]
MQIDVSLLANAMISNEFILLWSLSIVAYAFFWIFKMIFRSKALIGEFKGAMHLLAQLKILEGSDKKFKKKLDVFLKLPLIAPFADRLFVSDRCDSLILDSQVISAINEESIISPRLDKNAYQSIGSHLSGMGVLGTFIGLSASIYLARKGLMGSNFLQMRDSLDQLLGGAALAFWTSMVGVGCSLLYNRVEIAVFSTLRYKLQTLIESIATIGKRFSQEEVSINQLNANTSQLRYLEQIAGSLEALNNKQQKIQEEILREVVNDFRNGLAEGAPQEMKAIADNCLRILSSIKANLGEMQDSNSYLVETSKKIGEAIEEPLQKAAGVFHTKIIDTIERMERALDGATSQIGKNMMTESVAATQQIQEPIIQLGQIVHKLTDKTRRATDDWTDAMISMERLVRMLDKERKHFANGNEKKASPDFEHPVINFNRENFTDDKF